jgi:signal transduction histidine kinase
MASRRTVPAWVGAAAIGLFQVIGSFGAANNQPDRKSIDAIAVVLVLLGPLALAFRDRWPLVALVVSAAAADVYVALGYPYGPVFLSVVVALFVAVQTGRRRQVWAITAAAYAGFVVAAAVDPRSEGPDALHLALVAGWLVVVVAVSEVARGRREQAVARARAEQEERQRRQGEQRLQLAQELHDVLAHTISLINVQASVALHLLDEQPEQARPALTTIKDSSREALHELRAALDLLRQGDDGHEPAERLAPAPRLVDLPALVDGVRAGGLDVRLEQDEPDGPLPTAVELAAYRIAQEALTNVSRHAHARSVTVRVRCADGVDIEVLDDGRGGVPVPGIGLAGMRERAAAVGGTFEAGPRPAGGFRVAAHLPGPTP